MFTFSPSSQDSASSWISTAACIACTVSASLIALKAYSLTTRARDPFNRCTDNTKSKHALVLIAHPDDESYFFAPILQALKHTMAETHLVCLSDGSAGGDGDTRKRELLTVKEMLQLEGLCIVDTEDLRDGMATEWPEKTVMAVLDAYTEGAPVAFDYVVTFDGCGVSGHVNHVATYRGTKKWIEEKRKERDVMHGARGGDMPALPQVWVLESANTARKLSGPLDVAMSYVETCLDSHRRVFVPSLSLRRVFKAVRLHKSQFVWYRKLFVVFSRFTYMNTLRRID